MIKLMIEKSGQYFVISIENKKIFYWDRLQGKIWGSPLQYLPPDPKVNKKIDMSRNKIPQEYKKFLEISKEEMAEFDNAKTDEELKEIVMRDVKKHGCKILKETNE